MSDEIPQLETATPSGQAPPKSEVVLLHRGADVKFPTIGVVYQDRAGVQIVFDDVDFHTWEFVVGVLKMALDKAEFMRNAENLHAIKKAELEQMQRQALAAQQAQEIKQKLEIAS